MADPTDQNDPTPEQNAPAAPEQPPVAVLDPAPAPEPEPTAEPEPAAAAATTEPPDDTPGSDPPPVDDYSSDEGIMAAAERNPHLAGYLRKQKADGANEGAQAKETELRRASGAPDAVKRFTGQLFEKYGVTPSEGDTKATEFMTQQAMGYVFAEFTERIPEALLKGYDIPVAAREEAVALRESNDYDGMLRTYLTAAAKDTVGKMTLADVPEGSPLSKAIKAEATRIAGEELRAHGIETATPTPGAPPTPNGKPVGTKGTAAGDFDLKVPGQGLALARAQLGGEL